MFGKSSVPERQSFQLDVEEITADIESISFNEEERNKLYLSLDNQPPKHDHCAKLEDFVKRTDDREVLKQKLVTLMDEVDKLVLEISSKVEEIQCCTELIPISETANSVLAHTNFDSMDRENVMEFT